MIRKVAKSAAMASAVISAAIGVVAATASADKSDEQAELDKALARYERTGEMKRCISQSQIRSTRAVDDKHIIIEMVGKTSYLSTLERSCHSLKFHNAIAYRVHGASLCKNDRFRVLDGSRVAGPTCGFGEFEKLTRKTKPGKDKEPS